MALPKRSLHVEHREHRGPDDPSSPSRSTGIANTALSFLERKEPIDPARIVLLSAIAALALSVIFAFQDNAAGRLQTGAGLLAFGGKIAAVLGMMILAGSGIAILVDWFQRQN